MFDELNDPYNCQRCGNKARKFYLLKSRVVRFCTDHFKEGLRDQNKDEYTELELKDYVNIIKYLDIMIS